MAKSDSRDTHVRHTYTDGRYHRDKAGRFAAAGLTAAGFTAAGGAGALGALSYDEARRKGAAGDRLYSSFKDAKGPAKRQLGRQLAGLANDERTLLRGAKVLGGVAGAGLAAGTAGLYLHGRKPHEVAKFLEGVKRKLDSLPDITPNQARSAGTYGQIGAGAGAVTGAVVGASLGAAAKKPAQGAGLGGAVGGAIGGGAGAAAGLYAGRPRKKKKLTGTAPKATTLAKAHDKAKAAAVGGVTGGALSAMIGSGAGSAAARVRSEASAPRRQFVHPSEAGTKSPTRPATLAEYKRSMGRAYHLERTAEFHNSVKGKAAVIGAGALAGVAVANHRKKKQLAAVTPVAKMDDETKTKLARAGIMGAQVADIAAVKSAYHETMNAKKEGTGFKAALSYGAKRAALPVVAGGLVATVAAERVMSAQQKKLRAANTAGLKPRTPRDGDGDGVRNEGKR